MKPKICVYCSSSDALPEVYYDVASELGALIGKSGYDLVYGGGSIGMMGVIAKAVQVAGGKVNAVIPEKLHKFGLAYQDAEDIIITKDMRERKSVMEEKAHAFIALPGGIGTLEEFLEILTLKQLGYHNKPVVIINTNNFFAPIIRLFDEMEKNYFTKPNLKLLYHVAKDPADALSHIKTYIPPKVDVKWFDKR